MAVVYSASSIGETSCSLGRRHNNGLCSVAFGLSCIFLKGEVISVSV